MISKGLADAARSHAAHNVRELLGWVTKGYTIVGCEPSCILTFRDEYNDLLEGEAVQKVGDACLLLDEFIDRETREGRWRLEFGSVRKKALLHTHCHQKALVGSLQLNNMLSAAYEVSEVDSGCCGMAGSFGYEKEHYQISEKIGSQILFPAIEKSESNDIIVANGFSCRHQIEHFTGKKAKHWVELVGPSGGHH